MDLGIFDTEEAQQIRGKIREYVGEVSKDGWEYLFTEPFNSEEFKLFKEIYKGIYQLEASSPLQVLVKESLVSDSQKVADLIQVRLYSTRPESNNLIYTTIFGILICMSLFSIYPPDRLSVLMASGYLAFLGVVLYFILMMTTPLEGPMQIRASPFDLLEETFENLQY